MAAEAALILITIALMLGLSKFLRPSLVVALGGVAVFVMFAVFFGVWWPIIAPSVVGLVVAWVRPVLRLPDPSGEWAVGTTTIELSDANRGGAYATSSDGSRALVIQFWYPSVKPPENGAFAAAFYMGRTANEAKTVASGLASSFRLPSFVFRQPARSLSSAFVDAPVVPGNGVLPLLLFSPGFGGVRGQNTAWAQELASRGYVVAAVDHPHDSSIIMYENGETVSSAIQSRLKTGTDRTELIDELAHIRAVDLSFVMSQLEAGQVPPVLRDHIDIGRVSVAGHSGGGIAAIISGLNDSRFRAVINLDGEPPTSLPGSAEQPILSYSSDIRSGKKAEFLKRVEAVLAQSKLGGIRLTIPGTAHLTFSDTPLMLPPIPFLSGSVEAKEGQRLLVDSTAIFLEGALSGRNIEDIAEDLSRFGSIVVRN